MTKSTWENFLILSSLTFIGRSRILTQGDAEAAAGVADSCNPLLSASPLLGWKGGLCEALDLSLDPEKIWILRRSSVSGSKRWIL